MTHAAQMIRCSLAACVLATLLPAMATAQTAKPAATKPVSSAKRQAAPVASAVLRITCDGKNVKAVVSINGVFKGECPLDADVPAGMITVKASKSVNKIWELVYEEQFRLGADIAKRVEIVLKDRQFRADAVARMDAEVEALLSAREAQQRSELPALEQTAKGGDAAAMRRLGTVHKFGLEGKVDFKKAAHWYGLGAAAKDPVSMFEFASLLTQGMGVPANEAKAVELLREAAVAGNPGAMDRVAFMMLEGEKGFQKNVVAATDYWEKAAEAGVSGAELMWKSGERELKRKNLDNVDRKAEQLKKTARDVAIKAAESFEDFKATGQAAISYMDSRGDEEQEKYLRYSRMTMRYSKKAAATGEIAPIRWLARDYKLGYFTPKDLPTAIRLYRQAAALGDAEAIKALSELES